MTTHTHQSAVDAALIHPHPTTADMVASASVAAVFLDSLSIRPYTLRITELGRVEAYVDPALFDRARRVLLSEGATVHNEDGFVYVEARLDGVPVQVWTGTDQ
jgi:hypothetical protein